MNSHQPAGLHRLTSVVIGESKNVAKKASLIWKGPPSILGNISPTQEACDLLVHEEGSQSSQALGSC